MMNVKVLYKGKNKALGFKVKAFRIQKYNPLTLLLSIRVAFKIFNHCWGVEPCSSVWGWGSPCLVHVGSSLLSSSLSAVLLEITIILTFSVPGTLHVLHSLSHLSLTPSL